MDKGKAPAVAGAAAAATPSHSLKLLENLGLEAVRWREKMKADDDAEGGDVEVRQGGSILSACFQKQAHESVCGGEHASMHGCRMETESMHACRHARVRAHTHIDTLTRDAVVVR